MKVGASHLTYCTNIHAGETWPEVFDNLRTHLLAVRSLLLAEGEFGIGLRLSAAAADALAMPAALAEFRSFLGEHELYVFTINGFPYGTFHGASVKQNVYQPDWTKGARSEYTARLIQLLSTLLPAGMQGSISTVPGGFKRELTSQAALERVVDELHRQVALLVKLEREHGQRIVLALEPEPCCLLETAAETRCFFEQALLEPGALTQLGRRLGVSPSAAADAVREHLGVCLDACHAAVEFEQPSETLAEFRAAGIRVAKIQASTGLRLPEPDQASLDALRAYDEPVYLHQVVARLHDGELLRFEDLPEALASNPARHAAEWRVHFHVPVYSEMLGAFSNTQQYLSDLLALQRAAPVTEHVEVETYTWDVLPPDQRKLGLVPSIARELGWVRERLSV